MGKAKKTDEQNLSAVGGLEDAILRPNENSHFEYALRNIGPTNTLKKNIQKTEVNFNPLKQYSFAYDKNWYYNSKNVSNSELVFETFDFLEMFNFDALDFVNLMYKQHLEIHQYLDRPFDYLEHIKKLPLDKVMRFHLIAMILKWNGGFPPVNFDKQLQTILKLLYKEIEQSINNEDDLMKPFNLFYSNLSKKEEISLAFFNLSNAMGGTKFKSDYVQEIEMNTKPEEQLITPIRLNASKTQIVYLFQSLIKENFITETLNPKLWSLVSKYFVDKDNKPLTNIHQTKDNLNNGKSGKPKRQADTIDSLITQVKKTL